MDTGRAPPIAVSQEAHAGCLSFELSARQYRIVVNCGLPANRESWRQVARATAAHSTATFNDTSSCRFLKSGSLSSACSGTPVVGGPREVLVSREEQGGGVLCPRSGRPSSAAIPSSPASPRRVARGARRAASCAPRRTPRSRPGSTTELDRTRRRARSRCGRRGPSRSRARRRPATRRASFGT